MSRLSKLTLSGKALCLPLDQFTLSELRDYIRWLGYQLSNTNIECWEENGSDSAKDEVDRRLEGWLMSWPVLHSLCFDSDFYFSENVFQLWFLRHALKASSTTIIFYVGKILSFLRKIYTQIITLRWVQYCRAILYRHCTFNTTLDSRRRRTTFATIMRRGPTATVGPWHDCGYGNSVITLRDVKLVGIYLHSFL